MSVTTYTVTLKNAAGPLDSFTVKEDGPSNYGAIASALIRRLTTEWTVLEDGDTITIRFGE